MSLLDPLNNSAKKKSKASLLLAWLSLLGVLIGLGLVLKASFDSTSTPNLLTGSFLPEPRPLAAFNLVSERGTAFTNADLRGHWTVVFAGYRHVQSYAQLRYKP
jgi:protein SCO1/2